MKYRKCPAMINVLVCDAAALFKKYWKVFKGTDLVIPVPLHPLRVRQRGYDQSLTIAALVSRVLGAPLHTGGLMRKRYTRAQNTLTVRQRRKNVEGAVRCACTSDIEGARVLLTDDLVTTGATLTECAKVLVKAGASNVSAFTIARSLKKNLFI